MEGSLCFQRESRKKHVCPADRNWSNGSSKQPQTAHTWLLLLPPPHHSVLPSPENEWSRTARLRKNANLSSMERSKPSSPVSLAGGDAALSKYFHHLLLLPTRSPGLAHLSEALCLPHSKVQEHEVPRCPGCLHHMEHGFLRVAPHLSPDSCSLRS